MRCGILAAMLEREVKEAVTELLVALYDEPGGLQKLVGGLPGNKKKIEANINFIRGVRDVADDVVTQLARHRLLDEEFFRRLLMDHPGYSSVVQSVATDFFGFAVSASPASRVDGAHGFTPGPAPAGKRPLAPPPGRGGSGLLYELSVPRFGVRPWVAIACGLPVAPALWSSSSMHDWEAPALTRQQPLLVHIGELTYTSPVDLPSGGPIYPAMSVKGGQFLMGSADGPGDPLMKRYPDEGVDFTRIGDRRRKTTVGDLIVGTKEISWGLWRNVTETEQDQAWVRAVKPELKGTSRVPLADPSSTYRLLAGLDITHLPVWNVSWCDAVRFANLLTQMTLPGGREAASYVVDATTGTDGGCAVERLTGRNGWRLPTEAEAEWLLRQGWEDSKLGSGDPSVPCCHQNVADSAYREAGTVGWPTFACDDGHAPPSPVGAMGKDRVGLYDTVGNVREWCEDLYYLALDSRAGENPVALSPPLVAQLDPGLLREVRGECQKNQGTCRCVRGGSFQTQPRMTRPTRRDAEPPTQRGRDLGFRLVRNAGPDPG